ncbi:TSC22 domain family protein 1 isoform X3 [Pygocentrus nattereri]|uniref:TSC22 domain family protein 1 n=1 Tax=Pygocentrus nattereri TaxID=42514 RepID=A0A3B4C064_PYGNA|nr:TSC22 domain family protein 1 isoform X3 [Pygocentrus nattereri]
MREKGFVDRKGPDRMALKFLFWELEQHLSSSGASVVAIDNKIEQAMDLVKSHLMYAVREEVEVLKEQIKELIERNSQLEQENNLLKNLASPEQLAQFQAQVQTSSPTSGTQPASLAAPAGPPQSLPPSQGMGPPV